MKNFLNIYLLVNLLMLKGFKACHDSDRCRRSSNGGCTPNSLEGVVQDAMYDQWEKWQVCVDNLLVALPIGEYAIIQVVLHDLELSTIHNRLPVEELLEKISRSDACSMYNHPCYMFMDCLIKSYYQWFTEYDKENSSSSTSYSKNYSTDKYNNGDAKYEPSPKLQLSSSLSSTK